MSIDNYSDKMDQGRESIEGKLNKLAELTDYALQKPEEYGQSLQKRKEVTLLYNQTFLVKVGEIHQKLKVGEELSHDLKMIGEEAYKRAYPEGAKKPSFEDFIAKVADTSDTGNAKQFDFSGRTFRPAV